MKQPLDYQSLRDKQREPHRKPEWGCLTPGLVVMAFGLIGYIANSADALGWVGTFWFGFFLLIIGVILALLMSGEKAKGRSPTDDHRK